MAKGLRNASAIRVAKIVPQRHVYAEIFTGFSLLSGVLNTDSLLESETQNATSIFPIASRSIRVNQFDNSQITALGVHFRELEPE